MRSPLAGAWEYVLMRKNRQPIEGHDLMPDEALEIYQGVNALSGTYTVSGSRMTLKKTASLRADVQDVDLVAEFSIDGDQMMVCSISGTSRPRHDVWRKVS